MGADFSLGGVRDENSLQSALSHPQQLEAYRIPPPDVADLAAGYAHHIARNHAFYDGNKRASFFVSELFLRLNGYVFSAAFTEAAAELLWVDLADGRVSEQELADWFRSHIEPAQ
jgi:death-on-curing protein